jgi:hypothetical protein
VTTTWPQAALTAERARAARVEAELPVAKARVSDDQALIAHQSLQIEKLTRQIYGQRSERTVRLVDQIELVFEELESSATEDEIAAERAVAMTTGTPAKSATYVTGALLAPVWSRRRARRV